VDTYGSYDVKGFECSDCGHYIDWGLLAED